ncbi:Uncharacterised protein [Candidatus Venteria ishoeyi]|uniref:Uncharacterized protein n=1 Tax=Candidatus Venteria ishoeyi TaxID=1899563 RepID=A0A1H6F918_9GAMM|nr:Uncharacterised protein [Candidatus Venteria ishoeyi]
MFGLINGIIRQTVAPGLIGHKAHGVTMFTAPVTQCRPVIPEINTSATAVLWQRHDSRHINIRPMLSTFHLGINHRLTLNQIILTWLRIKIILPLRQFPVFELLRQHAVFSRTPGQRPYARSTFALHHAPSFCFYHIWTSHTKHPPWHVCCRVSNISTCVSSKSILPIG